MTKIFTGRGYLAVLYLAGTLIAFDVMVTLTLGEAQFFRWPWLFGVGVVFAAAVNWILGRGLNRPKTRHTFCRIPMEYWSAPVLVAGLVLIGHGLFERYGPVQPG